MRASPRLLAGAMAATAVALAAAAARDVGGRLAPPQARSALPLDQLMLTGLAVVVVGLACCGQTPRLQRLGCLLSTFLAIFAAAASGAAWMQWAVITFTLVGMLWLMADHWQSLGDRFVATQQRRRRWVVALPLATVLILAVAPPGGRQIVALEGFVPAAGGRDRFLEAAAGGAGAGDHLVAGMDDIQSFAPLEDAPFMTSHEPTLYDLFDDTYNEPRSNPRQQRSIALPPQTSRRPENHRARAAPRASREFSLVRRPGRRSAPCRDESRSPAILQVKGRLPLHLKLESFDLFDGVSWRPEPVSERPPPLAIQAVRGKPWLRINAPSDERLLAAAEIHAIRVVSLDSSRIPAPNRLGGVHIADVDRADFYRWAQADVLQLDRETVPELTTVHLQSRVVDARGFAAPAGSMANAGPASCRQFGDDPRSLAVKELVASWVVGLPRGWRQIERVVERIRADNRLDAEARASADSSHAVAEFLLDTRRGPDYLFASATVWALRSLGYAARLVGGFYVAADAHDPRSGHAAVHADDVHFWAEVAVGTDMWASLEATPGYELLGPPSTRLERLVAAARAAMAWIAGHPFMAACVLAAVAATAWWRWPLVDAVDRLCVAVWNAIDRVGATPRLLRQLERRCRRAGLPRPRHRTPTAWLARLAADLGRTTAAEPQAFLAAAARGLYRPPAPDGGVDADPLAAHLRRAAQRTWSWHNLRTLASQGASP